MVLARRHAYDVAGPVSEDLIVCIDGVMGGRPVIRGTRITVAAVQGRVSGGDSIEDLILEYPDVAREAFEAARDFEVGPPRPGS